MSTWSEIEASQKEDRSLLGITPVPWQAVVARGDDDDDHDDDALPQPPQQQQQQLPPSHNNNKQPQQPQQNVIHPTTVSARTNVHIHQQELQLQKLRLQQEQLQQELKKQKELLEQQQRQSRNASLEPPSKSPEQPQDLNETFLIEDSSTSGDDDIDSMAAPAPLCAPCFSVFQRSMGGSVETNSTTPRANVNKVGGALQLQLPKPGAIAEQRQTSDGSQFPDSKIHATRHYVRRVHHDNDDDDDDKFWHQKRFRYGSVGLCATVFLSSLVLASFLWLWLRFHPQYADHTAASHDGSADGPLPSTEIKPVTWGVVQVDKEAPPPLEQDDEQDDDTDDEVQAQPKHQPPPPTWAPTHSLRGSRPSAEPTVLFTLWPTTVEPSLAPSSSPSTAPTQAPTARPTCAPTADIDVPQYDDDDVFVALPVYGNRNCQFVRNRVDPLTWCWDYQAIRDACRATCARVNADGDCRE